MNLDEQQRRANRFRDLHHAAAPLILPNPWDIGSARLFAHLGFAALATTGGGRAFSIGVPDGSTDPEALLAYAADIAHATDLPVTADLEDGFGETPVEVAVTVERAAGLGLVGGSIEDRSYGRARREPGMRPFDVGLAAERIAAAVEAASRAGCAFTVTARCENHLIGRDDLPDTIARLRAYEAAGAHCVYAPGLQTIEQVRAVVDAVGVPVNALIGRSIEPMTVDALAEIGVRRISVGSGIQRTAMAATIAAAREILEHGTTGLTDAAIAHDEACRIFADQS